MALGLTRSQCDLQRERCGQCRRANIACFGWPDPNQLIIRDETASAQRKVLARSTYRAPTPAPVSAWEHWHPFNISSASGPSPSSGSSTASYASTVSTPNPSTQVTEIGEEYDGDSELSGATNFNYMERTLPFEQDKIPTSLSFSWEVRARNAFFSHYVLGFSRSHDALSQLYAASSATSLLSAAVDAAALAFLAKQHEAPGQVTVYDTASSSELVSLMSRSYIVAIKRLSTVLSATSRRPAMTVSDQARTEEALSDATLQAVLLLDLCEKLACVGRRPDRASAASQSNNSVITEGPWLSHLRGALDLVHIRGLNRRYSSLTSRRLAARLAMTLVISCGVAGVHIPRELEEFRTGLLLHLVGVAPHFENHGIVSRNMLDIQADPKFAVTGLVIGVVNLAADVSQGNCPPGDLIRRATALDDRLAAMECELPSSWQFERIYTVDWTPMVHSDHYDKYADHFVTQVRNVARSMRLLLVEMTMEHCQAHDDMGDDHTRTSRLIDSLCGDICAAVPQFVWTQARPENSIPFTSLQSLQCYTLLSPLYLAAKLSNRYKMRTWIIGMLQYMADSGGMKAANTVAGILQSRSNISYWQIYAILGSYAFAA